MWRVCGGGVVRGRGAYRVCTVYVDCNGTGHSDTDSVQSYW
jgi:hypothetical protein